MKHPLLDRWVRVLSSISPGKAIPNINTATTKNMSVTVLEQLREVDPELYQSDSENNDSQHIDSQVCSMRIFEGIVAGVPIIADKNPFYLKYFKDNIWYFENNNVYSALSQIVNHIKFIKNNEEIVKKKIINTRNIFKNYFCTDMQLSYIVNKLENKLN